MQPSNRRRFLAQVGQGMLIAGVGVPLAHELGLASSCAQAFEPSTNLTFGDLEPLVTLMEETAPDRLLQTLAERYRPGLDLAPWITAGTLANARGFGGEDYIGFHTMMAFGPAYRMSQALPEGERALPVLKVLYRNAQRLHHSESRTDVLQVAPAANLAALNGRPAGEAILEAVRRKDLNAAEVAFAAVSANPDEALNQLLIAVEDGQEVHRINTIYRAWDLLDIVGREHAGTMLRQSVHFCVKSESPRYSGQFAAARALLPRLLDQHNLLNRSLGTRIPDDNWVEDLSRTIFQGPPEQAASAVAAALADGVAPACVGEAIALAANQLLLRDEGRPQREAQANKPVGSVHGDGIGVHACDSANAWKNLARVSNARNTVCCLILGAYQASRDRLDRGGDFLTWEAYPRANARERVRANELPSLLTDLRGAIEAKDQALASAVVDRCARIENSSAQVFDVLLGYTVSQDGALHGEKFYRTVTDEFASARPAFRWRHLVGLARVTASAYGFAAPGYSQARELLGV